MRLHRHFDLLNYSFSSNDIEMRRKTLAVTASAPATATSKRKEKEITSGSAHNTLLLAAINRTVAIRSHALIHCISSFIFFYFIFFNFLHFFSASSLVFVSLVAINPIDTATANARIATATTTNATIATTTAHGNNTRYENLLTRLQWHEKHGTNRTKKKNAWKEKNQNNEHDNKFWNEK